MQNIYLFKNNFTKSWESPSFPGTARHLLQDVS